MTKLLIADDDKAMLGLLTTLLELEGYTVVTETDPESILETIHSTRPDLILLDVHVAGKETLAVLQQIKSAPALNGIPTIMISGMELRNQCLALGADDFILKPFHPQELLDHILPLVEGDEEAAQP
jgi:DNA-binding response OmpR family regulator